MSETRYHCDACGWEGPRANHLRNTDQLHCPRCKAPVSEIITTPRERGTITLPPVIRKRLLNIKTTMEQESGRRVTMGEVVDSILKQSEITGEKEAEILRLHNVIEGIAGKGVNINVGNSLGIPSAAPTLAPPPPAPKYFPPIIEGQDHADPELLNEMHALFKNAGDAPLPSVIAVAAGTQDRYENKPEAETDA